jgi:hypothetical protein
MTRASQLRDEPPFTVTMSRETSHQLPGFSVKLSDFSGWICGLPARVCVRFYSPVRADDRISTHLLLVLPLENTAPARSSARASGSR